jgi:hypothetical protein
LTSEAGRGVLPAGVAGRRDAGTRPRLRSFFVWLLFHRFHLLLAAALVGFPWFARGPAAPFAANLFVLGFGEQVAVATLATVAGQVLVIVTWTSTRAGPLRLWPGTGDAGPEQAIRLGYREFRHAFRRSWGTSRRLARRMPVLAPWLAIALAAPTLATLHAASGEGELTAALSLGALFVGVLLAQLVLAAAALATAWLTPAEARHGLLEGSPLARRLAALARRRTLPGAEWLRDLLTSCLARGPFGPGYVWVDPAGRRSLHSGHLAAAGLFAATLAVYVALGVANRPGAEAPLLGRLPALGALLLVLTMAAWIVPALSFLLDRFRAPVVAAIVLVSFALYALAGADHFFTLRAPAAALPASPAEDLALVDSWFASDVDGHAAAADRRRGCGRRRHHGVGVDGGGALRARCRRGGCGVPRCAEADLGRLGRRGRCDVLLDRLPPVALREMRRP